MPRPRFPYLQHQKTRHNKRVWYVRIGKGPRVRLKAKFGTPEFHDEYQAAIAGVTAPRRPGFTAKAGTVAWLLDAYRASGDWAALSAATHRQRDNIFVKILDTAGGEPFARITGRSVSELIDKKRDTPFQAKNTLDALKGLFRWAVKAGHVPKDPTAGITTPRPQTGGFAQWTRQDIEAFEAKWPLGTRPRVAFDVLRYAGFRRGDAASLGPEHVDDGTITLETAKTGEVVTILMHPDLKASIEAGPVGATTFIARKDGKPFTKESFGNMFRDWCNEAGVTKSAHGLRKYLASKAAERGATEKELEAMFGWTGGQMAALYTRAADRKRLGKQASKRLIEPASIPSPHAKVRAPDEIQT